MYTYTLIPFRINILKCAPHFHSWNHQQELYTKKKITKEPTKIFFLYTGSKNLI